MQDLLVLLFSSIGRFFNFLDSLTILGTLSLFKIILIFLIFTFIIKFIGGNKKDDE